MKKLILLFSLFTLTVYAQEPEVPYSFPVPERWGKEKFNLPISFAPSIPYKGVEEIRFAPGWSKKDSANYWSYIFLWCIDDKNVTTDAATLQDQMKIYYEGLASATKSIPTDKLIPASASISEIKTEKGDSKTFKGSIQMQDYMTQKPLTLYCKIHLSAANCYDKTFIFFELSPQPMMHKVWTLLDKAHSDFKYKK